MNTFEYKVEIFDSETGEIIDSYIEVVNAENNDEAVAKVEDKIFDLEDNEDYEITLVDVH